MVKILYLPRFLNTVDGGGSSVSLDHMARLMADRGHKVDIAPTDIIKTNSNSNYNIIDDLKQRGDKSKSSFFIDLRSRIPDISDDYDIIHIFNPSLLPIIGSVADQLNCSTVGRLNTYSLFCTNLQKMNGECHSSCGVINKFRHDSDSISAKTQNLPRYISQTYIEPKWASKIDRFFAISPAVKNIYTDYGIPGDKISIVPNMMENLDKTAVTDNKGTTELNLLYLGRLEPQKGVDLLIDVVTNLQSERVHLDIVGNGVEMEKLQSSIPSSSSDMISFHGRVPHSEIGEYYGKSDMFVHPHRWPEPFGRVILEALQYKCPVLSANIGAPPWISGSAGYEFKTGDTEDLRMKIKYAIDNPDIITDMSSQATTEIQKFSKDNILPLIESGYNDILADSS